MHLPCNARQDNGCHSAALTHTAFGQLFLGDFHSTIQSCLPPFNRFSGISLPLLLFPINTFDLDIILQLPKQLVNSFFLYPPRKSICLFYPDMLPCVAPCLFRAGSQKYCRLSVHHCRPCRKRHPGTHPMSGVPFCCAAFGSPAFYIWFLFLFSYFFCST